MSNYSTNRVPFGLDQNNKLREVSEVKPGIQCGCICPCCSAPLIAVRPLERRWHFRHASQGQLPSCHGRESSMHLMGKAVFIGDDLVPPIETLRVPELLYTKDRPLPNGRIFRHCRRILEAGDCNVSAPEIEQTCYTPERNNHIRPDVLVDVGDAKIAVEICVWNPVSAEKRERLEGFEHPVLQIHLPRDAGWEKLAVRTLVATRADRQWVYWPENAEFNREFETKFLAECGKVELEMARIAERPDQRSKSPRWESLDQDHYQANGRPNAQTRTQDAGEHFKRRNLTEVWVVRLADGTYLGKDLNSVASPIYARHLRGKSDENEALAMHEGGELVRLVSEINAVDRKNPSVLFAQYFSRRNTFS